ncbi:hypothetical protein JG687_00006631 [Phytophthora cactorum]|uniref:Uncharacterized protein n=1 Tax=Phytophthora cactorum TaxID=29920 RepID=A0A8T1UHS2_9STRA|nr:hypothetical protein JG687_00006631 [Phytophthora cactorum]
MIVLSRKILWLRWMILSRRSRREWLPRRILEMWHLLSRLPQGNPAVKSFKMRARRARRYHALKITLARQRPAPIRKASQHTGR